MAFIDFSRTKITFHTVVCKFSYGRNEVFCGGCRPGVCRAKGVSLTDLIEGYLSRLIQKEKAPAEATPDIVLSLLGAGEPVEDDDLNGRKAYYERLKEKYQ